MTLNEYFLTTFEKYVNFWGQIIWRLSFQVLRNRFTVRTIDFCVHANVLPPVALLQCAVG